MSRKYQQGVYAVEFAIVATVVLTLMFAAFEAARLMYAHNILVEASRRAARLAVVCAPSVGVPAAPAALRDLAMFDGTSLLRNLSTDNLSISYLTQAGAQANTWAEIVLVRATISNYQHALIIPGFFITLNSPAFSTTLPRESLGATRFGTTWCS